MNKLMVAFQKGKSGCLVLAAILITGVGTGTFGQSLKNIIPPSPNVASLGKYGDVPVGLYTGIPKIEIPLYDIKSNNLSLPISLSYYSSGVRVEEIASNVGLGWTLNAGGVVGRSVRGVPDDVSSWANTAPANRIETIMQSGNSILHSQLANEVELNHQDGEADLYYYNFAGYTGKFFFDQAGGVHTVPSKNIAIVPYLNGWKITGEDGTVYTFTSDEYISTSNCSEGGDQSVFGAWYLTSITSADGKSQITFQYDFVQYVYTTLLGQIKYYSINYGNCLQSPYPCLSSNSYATHRLARIGFTDGFIKFKYNNVRADLVDDKSLDVIEVYTKDSTLKKRFNLAYAYFGDNSDGPNRLTEINKRLKLLSVTEGDGVIQKPPYTFEYDESTALPSRHSYAQDHWGYYNNKLNNPHLIATFVTVNQWGIQVVVPGADRKVNPNTVQAAILKKIKYPTGGESIFTYECNTVSDGVVEPEYRQEFMNLGANQTWEMLPTPFESPVIDIPAEGAIVHFTISGLASQLWQGCDIAQLQVIKDNNPTPYRTLDNGLDGASEPWPQGSYRLRMVTSCGYGSFVSFSASVYAEVLVYPSLTTRNVGGLRIKKVESTPGPGGTGPNVIKQYRYNQFIDPTKSSGFLVNNPDYGYDLSVSAYESGGGFQACNYRVRQSFSNYPLAKTQGSYVGYENVTEDLGDNGESRYTFSAYSDPSGGFPFAPIEMYDWRRGFLLNTKHYAKRNNQLTLVKEIINHATNFNEYRVYGIKTGRSSLVTYNGSIYLGCCAPGAPSLPPTPPPSYAFYPTISEFFGDYQTIEKTYDPNDPARYVETVTTNEYSPQHLQVIQKKIQSSGTSSTMKDELVINMKYPSDYTFSAAPVGNEAAGIKKLQDLHVVNAVVEEYTTRQTRNTTNGQLSNQRVTSGSISTFRTDYPYADQVLRLQTNTPVTLASFGSGSAISGNTFIKNSNGTIVNQYKPVLQFMSYDDKGNLSSQRKMNDALHTCIWGYDKQFPVAEVINAELKDIFYTGFEEGDGNSSAGDSKTGRKSKTGGYTQSLSNLTNGNYTLSYWQKSGGNWTLQQSTVAVSSGSYSISLAGQVDDVRFHPAVAQMTTYTYDPLIGMTSSSTAANQITYYEYDGLGRLVLVRDMDRNILKKYCYNYYGQPDNCSLYYNAAVSGSFTRNNCGVGYTGSTVTYTIPAGQYSASTQAAADVLAQNALNANGQAYANANGTCIPVYYNVITSGNFTRNNCPLGVAGSTVTYSVPAGVYFSTASQAAANQLAQNDVDANGQAYANANGTCAQTFYNAQFSTQFTRDNCGPGYGGSTVTYTIPAGTYSSTTSQAAADQLAINAMYANGQAYANANGTCIQLVPFTCYNYLLYGNFMIEVYSPVLGDYFFTAESGSNIIGYVPPGNYDIYIYPLSGWQYYTFNTCGGTTYGYSASFYNVSITDSWCGYVTIY